MRVGTDFYLATSTFGMMPGIMLRHSTNLVDWRILGGAVTRPSQYRRDGRVGPVELFAPTLRHHEGIFYLVCTNVAEGQGNFLLTAPNPSGPWSDACWLDHEGFDPSLLFADGLCYYTRRSISQDSDGTVHLGPIVQAELDVLTGELGILRAISAATGGFCSNDIEGPHLYKINDYYYLFSAEGGSWTGHMQTCARSTSPWGPFEAAPHNPVLTHRHRVGHAIQTVGHAELVDAPDGSWWALCLGTRHEANSGFTVHHNLGRETFLAPVQWTADGWPLIGAGGTLELTMATPGFAMQKQEPLRPTATCSLWESGWRSIGLAASECPAQGESIELPFGKALDCSHSDSGIGALLLPQTEEAQTFTTTLEKLDAGGSAGIAVFSDREHHVEAVVVRSSDGSLTGTFRKVVDDFDITMPFDVPAELPLVLTIVATHQQYRFELGVPKQRTAKIGQVRARLLSAQAAEWFVGVHFALVSRADSAPAGLATFVGAGVVVEPTAVENMQY